MTEARSLSLGGRTFAVPPLPLRVTRVVYPICRGLTAGGLIERTLAAGGFLEVDAEEMAQIADVAFLCAQAAEPDLTRAEFEELPIAPPELIDAFICARYQTGAWLPPQPKGDDASPGEAEGAASPPTSTSTGSSPD